MSADAGKRLPDFDLPTSSGGRLSNADLAGHRTVLYFYPKDDTPGCTIEAHDFTELLPEFQSRDVRVFGISPDDVGSHDRFTEKCAIGFPLISDTDRRLCEAFNVWVEKQNYGKTYMGVERSTFLIDAEGKIAREWRAVNARGHAQAVLDAVSEVPGGVAQREPGPVGS